MVLSDTDYHIKIPINNNSNDSDKIVLNYKYLSSDDGEAIGKIIIFFILNFRQD